MVPFNKEELIAGPARRLDYQLMQDGPCILFYRQHVLDETVSWLRTHDYLIYTLDCSTWQNVDDAHEALSATLNFPDYYGRNLAALNDCLSDLEVPQESGVAIVFLHYHKFAKKEPEVANAILDIIATQSRYFLLFGEILMALVQSDNPRIAFEPVGCTSVTWNPAEWLTSKREGTKPS